MRFRRTSERHTARLRRHVRQLIFPPLQRRKKPLGKADDRSSVELSKQGAKLPLRDVRFFMRLVSFGRLESGTPYLSWPAMKCGGSRHQKNMCFLLDEAMQRDGKRRNRRTLLNLKGNRKSDTDTETRTKNRMPRSTRRLADEQRETS